jgi:hypothetical protein
MMKLFVLLFASIPSLLFAQNFPPNIYITNVIVDTSLQNIKVNFDVLDGIGPVPLDIKAFLSADSGLTYIAPMQNLTGMVGFPIFQGNSKNLTVWYNKDSLYQAAGGNSNAWFMIKIVADDQEPISIQNMIDDIDSSLVYQYMQYIAQPRNHIGAPLVLSAIKDSIENNFNRSNLQTKRDNFNFGIYGGQNIIGRKPGLFQEKKTIIVDAHFDAVNNSPGADDNGSSLTAVLIASKILSNFQFEKSLKFIAFDKEENGLLGSSFYVNNSIPNYEETESVLNMEMIGYYDDAPNSQLVPNGFSQLFPAAIDSISTGGNQGVWLFTVGNANSTSLSYAFDTIARNYVPNVKSLVLNVPGNGQVAPDLRRSDHAPFWDAGYSALMLTDGADFRNANYHTPGDSLETLNFPFLVRNVKAVTAVAASLAKPISASYAVVGPWQLIKGMGTGVEESEFKVNAEVFPNPSNQEIYLKFDSDIKSLQLMIHDSKGNLVFQKEMLNIKKGVAFTVPLDEMPAGVYFLSAKGEEFQFAKKIVLSEKHNH